MFNRYCIFIIDENKKTKSFLGEVSKISEFSRVLHYGSGGNNYIATFISSFQREELVTILEVYEQNYILFNIDSDDISINFIQKEIIDAIITPIKEYNINEMNQRFIETITEEPKFSYSTITLNKNLHDNYEHLDEFEKSFVVNKLIDKGFSLLTEEEKMILRKLSNNN